jgi:mannose-6-phosphate isomerase-like protein (cupin superfamily)
MKGDLVRFHVHANRRQHFFELAGDVTVAVELLVTDDDQE